ncbi:GNAT family N-acetyltransferase [Natronoglycomyces albus]|uniref:GNAT family N-acetyltransferase n=1 Tax=Natronoglycomyces albus TaxID=2811108 RepID=A0A895XJ69_9ACTN|nr:GNAT family N-acetyltransferase [Natronoglycomyces albus]QSB05384.1 GNAT family N-acetyltransferase [Natronoglycomyces albus]
MNVEIVAEKFRSPIAQELCAEVQAEYARRYDSNGDEAVIEHDDFDPPNGKFFVVYRDGEALGCGGWRAHGSNQAEMKRVFVREPARRMGLARRIVAAIEADAAANGMSRVILNTGPEQPEAIALYENLGYGPQTPFGFYAAFPQATFLGKDVSGHPDFVARVDAEHMAVES